jgi:hypothetical protein
LNLISCFQTLLSHGSTRARYAEVASGEENEDILFEAKSKAYRFIEVGRCTLKSS